MGDVWDIARKQMEDSFSSRRFLIILGIFLVITLASVYLGVQGYETQMSLSQGEDLEDPSLMQIFEPLMRFNLALTAGILGLLLSYNFISKEREEGTIELLLSYPIYRDEIINGKMIAGIFTVAFTLLIAFGVSSGLAIYLLDWIPSVEEISRLGFIWIGTTIYITFFLGLGTLLSTVFRSRWRALMTGMLILVLFIGTSFLATISASFLFPHDNSGTVNMGEDPGISDREEVEMQRERFVSTVSRISPSNSFNEYNEIMLGTRYETEEGLEPTFAESLRDAVDPLIYLISQTALIMTAAYAVFLRQDL